MFALDLFNTKYEKELHEGAVDNLEARRIDILNDRMDDLIRRASVPTNKEAREALMHEYNKVKAERDSYYKVNTLKTQDECMGYGTLGEEGIGQDIVNKQEKMARATPPTPAGKVASTVKNAAKWLAGKGGPGQEGPTYEAQEHNEDNYEQLLNAIAALYGPEIWDNDAMGDLANDLEQANPTPEELNFIIKNGKLPKRLQGIKFTNNDTVQFGEAAYTGDHDTDEKRIQQLMRKYHWSRQEAEEHLTSSESDHEKFDESSDTTLQQWTASVKQKFPDARFVQNKTTGEYIAQSTQGQGIVSRWNNGIKESSQKKNSEQVKEHHFIYEVRYGHPPGAGYFGDQWIQQGQAMQNQQAQAQKPQEDPWTGAAHGSSAQELDMFKAGKKPVSIQRIDDPLWKPLVDSGQYPTAVIYQAGRPSSVVIGQPNNGVGVHQVHQLVQTATQRGEAGDFGPYQNPKYHQTLGRLLGYSDSQINSFMSHYFKDKTNEQAVSEVDDPQAVHDAGLKLPIASQYMGDGQFKVTVKNKPYIVTVAGFEIDDLDPGILDSFYLTDVATGKTEHVTSAVNDPRAVAIYNNLENSQRPALKEIYKQDIELGRQTDWKERPERLQGLKLSGYNAIPADRFIKGHQDMKRVTGQDLDESQQLHQGDPIVVTGPNEFEGATGEIYDFSPSGKFIIVDLYNHGKHSMHLSDVAYNDYADQEEEDDWYDNQEVEEGFQDFNKVEPYAVCLAGKPVKKFDYYEEARRFHDNWKQKLYREGNKEKADKITLMPLNLDEMDSRGHTGTRDDYEKDRKYKGPVGTGKPATAKKVVKDLSNDFEKAFDKEKEVKEAGSPAQQAAIAIAKKKEQGVAEGVPTQAGAVDPKIQFLQPTIQFAEKLGYQVTLNPNPNGKIFVKLVNKQIEHTVRIGFSRGRDPGTKLEADMSDNWDSQTYAWSAKELAQDFKEFYKDALRDSPTQGQQGVAEGQTDYQKRRARERDVDAGRPVKPLPRNPQTDYARKRAKDRKDMEMGEGADLINMSDLQFYKELLGVMVIPVAAFGAMAWSKAMNAIKLYRAEDVITALQKKGVTVDRSTLEQIKPLLLKLEQAIDIDKDGDVAKELAKRIQQAVTWGKLKQANPKTNAKTTDTELGEEFEMPGTTIPRKSVIQGYVFYYNPKTRIVSITQRGDSEEAAIDQLKLKIPSLNSFNVAVTKLINRLEKDLVEAQEIRTRDDFIQQRDKLYRMIQLETNPANKQILKTEIRNLERRAAEEGWLKLIREENSTSSEAVEIAVIRRILVAHTDLIMEFGLDKVTQAIEEVAYNVGDVDEIGTSDVSAWVHEVKQILGAE